MDRLSLAEKATVVTGGNVSTEAGSFPGLRISDGQQGVLNSFFVSGWGQPGSLTMSWDKDAWYKQSEAISREYFIRGIHVVDGPTIAPLGRQPWTGRLMESFASDSYLSGIALGIAAKAEVDAGVISGGKHFLLYEQENNRTTTVENEWGLESYDSMADDKTIHETYLAPWYDGVKSGLGTVMCAMNLVNGTQSCENEDLLMGLLKTEVGFPGVVIPDIFAQKTVDGSANGGLDWASDQLWTAEIVEDLVSNGTVSQARINDMAIRNMVAYFHSGIDTADFPDRAKDDERRPIPEEHTELIRENGAKSLVLLKNVNSALPLKSPEVLSVFGAHAGPTVSGPNRAFFISNTDPGAVPIPETLQGHMASLSGAGGASLPYLVTPLDALTDRVRQDMTQFRWIANDTFTPVVDGFVPSGPSTGVLPSIKNYAQYSDVCIVFLNAFGGEGHDRRELRNAVQDDLVLEVASQCPNTIVVVTAAGPRIMDAWIENTNVTAVVYGGPLGQESGNSIIDVLYGDVNPAGRLTYTIAKDESDYDTEPCPTLKCEFTEGNYIDYKSFEQRDVEPRFEFGFGLSYTSFEYSNLHVGSVNVSAGLASGPRAVGGRADMWDEVAEITVEITNSGKIGGAEVAQLYMSFPAEADQPKSQLRGFDRLSLDAGESTTAVFTLRRKDLSYWDVEAQGWRVASGKYGINVGSSSRDFRVEGTLEI